MTAWHGFRSYAKNTPLALPGVYLLKEIATGRCYVGASMNLAARCKIHANATDPRSSIQRAIKEEGADAFLLIPLWYTPDASFLPETESSLQQAYSSLWRGFNEKELTSRNMHSLSARKQRGETCKATMASAAFKEQRSATMRAVHARPDVKEKHRASVIAANARPETKALIAASKRGRVWITNDEASRHVYPDTPLPIGWRYGKHR